nr:unnamed protein product [Callosobruchus chinensis]
MPPLPTSTSIDAIFYDSLVTSLFYFSDESASRRAGRRVTEVGAWPLRILRLPSPVCPPNLPREGDDHRDRTPCPRLPSRLAEGLEQSHRQSYK